MFRKGLRLVNYNYSYRRTGILLITLTLAGSLLIMSGCGGGMKAAVAAGTTTGFAFVANSASGNVSAFSVSNNGVLSPVTGSPFVAGEGAEFMAFDPVHKFLFVCNQGAHSVSAFSVDTGTGSLTSAPGSPVLTGTTPEGVGVDAAGQLLFVGNQSDNSISVFDINGTNGALTPVQG
jgi:6-phosphogluconolactonase (cycloisomerase 2 family)